MEVYRVQMNNFTRVESLKVVLNYHMGMFECLRRVQCTTKKLVHLHLVNLLGHLLSRNQVSKISNH